MWAATVGQIFSLDGVRQKGHIPHIIILSVCVCVCARSDRRQRSQSPLDLWPSYRRSHPVQPFSQYGCVCVSLHNIVCESEDLENSAGHWCWKRKAKTPSTAVVQMTTSSWLICQKSSLHIIKRWIFIRPTWPLSNIFLTFFRLFKSAVCIISEFKSISLPTQ